MLSMEKNVEKQLILRTFEPNMNALKQTGRQLAHMQDVSLNLYGQAGEVLIVITARAFAQAAATELTESVAEQFELSLGNAAYGRGKGNLAHFAAGELIQSESVVAAADSVTGSLLAEEFSHTKRGASVFDFGEESYHNSRIAGKIRNEAYKNADEEDPAQFAAACAAAAAKCCRADFGVSIVGLGGGVDVYAAVAYKKYVYLRRFTDDENAGKKSALAALDTIRLLAAGKTVERARMFRANSDFDWEEPLKKRSSKSAAGPIVALAVLLAALGVACWYFFTHFTLGTDQDSLPADGGASVSDTASLSGTDATAPSIPESTSPAGTPGGGEGSQTDASDVSGPEDGGDTAPVEPAGDSSQNGSGEVHPFG